MKKGKMHKYSKIGLSICCLAVVILYACVKVEPYKNEKNKIDVRVEYLLSRMSIDQKIQLLQGDGMSTMAIDSLHIPKLECSDGPFGAHRGGPITSFPCGTSLGASWDTSLVNQVANAIGAEARAKNIQCLLGPGINIIRHPLCGRNFEYYSEDPFLTGQLAVAFTKGIQKEKVAATLKHFAANNQEFYRNSLDVEIDERTLREIYLPAFKDAVVEGGAWSVMSAYNKVNGVHCSENKHLLQEILKDEWGFKGFVMPDWAGAHSTVASANNGLDCVVYDGDLFGKPLAEAVKKGEVSEERINEMTRRVLRVIFNTGLMNEKMSEYSSVLNSKEHCELNRRAAAEGIVLLKNENSVLPLTPQKYKKIAVIGPNAATLRKGGGGSSYNGSVFYEVSPLEGIQAAAGKEIQVEYALGVGIADKLNVISRKFLTPSNKSEGSKGLWAEYYNNMNLEGKPVVCQLDSVIDNQWQAGPNIYLSDYDKKNNVSLTEINKKIGKDYFSVRWTGKVTPPKTGLYDFVTQGDDGVRLYVNNQLLIDQWFSHDKEYRYGSIKLEAGKSYDIKLEYYEEIGGATMRLGWYYHDPKEVIEAVDLAKNSDAVVICAGIDKFWEAEGADRSNFELPLIQNELINAIAKVNKNVVVVLNNGGPLNVRPWIDQVPALVEAWFTGNEGGNAIADVLVGKHVPSGKLPYSYVQNESEFPPAFDYYKNRDKRVIYKEGLYVGYRYHDKFGTAPMFPFGFGLSYTTFEYSNLQIEKLDDNRIAVSFVVKNTGDTDGSEIAQLYVSELNPTVDRPIKELKGFQKALVRKNETSTYRIICDTRKWAYFDSKSNTWKLNKGKYRIQIGSSSIDMKLDGEVEL